MSRGLEKLRVALLRGKTWRYLRYIHFRDYLSRVSEEVESVCVVGTGHGLAELACAIEFPHIRFTLTDIIVKGLYPNYHGAMSMAWRLGVDNINFSIWDVLEPTRRRFDLVASTEMLEHVADVPTAVTNMRSAAAKYVYCLVPFGDEATNNDVRKRQRALERHEHLVYGFDQTSLESLFGPAVRLSGTYWADAGAPFRKALSELSVEQINAEQVQLMKAAEADIRDAVPVSLEEAAGIKILARADAVVPVVPVLPPTLEELIAREQPAAQPL